MAFSRKHDVFAQYIDQYEDIVNNTLATLTNNVNYLHVPYAQFLFSLIDYYGLLFRVADKNLNEKRKPENFKEFVGSKYFPATVRNKGEFLYFFRNGIIHQIFPKAGGINYYTNLEGLFFEEEGNPILNLYFLQKIIIQAKIDFIKELEVNENYIDNLHANLIEDKYALNDFNERSDIINKYYNGAIANLYV